MDFKRSSKHTFKPFLTRENIVNVFTDKDGVLTKTNLRNFGKSGMCDSKN